VTASSTARLPIRWLPAIIFAFFPIVCGSWFYFYKKQSAELARASSQMTSPEVLAKLARKGNVDVRLRVLLNPHTPEKARAQLAAEPTLRFYAVHQPSAPPEVLKAIAEDPKSRRAELIAAALHPNAPPLVLEALSGHRDPAVRDAVAERRRRDAQQGAH